MTPHSRTTPTVALFAIALALATATGCTGETSTVEEEDTATIQDTRGDGEADTQASDTRVEDTARTDTNAADTDTPDTTPTDTATADTGPSDTMIADASDTTVSDTTASDTADTAADTTDAADGTDVCAAAETLVDNAREEAAAGCTRATECGSRYNPLCPDGGCHTHFYLGNDLSTLDAANTSYQDNQCGSGAVCDCLPPPEALACVDGACTECPQTCDYQCALDCVCYKDACGCDQPFCNDGSQASCDALEARMVEAAADMATCTTDDDCVIDYSPLCPELGCHLAVNRHAPRGELQRLVDAYTQNQCSFAVCSCTPPPSDAVCNNGVCEGAATP